MDLQLTQEVTPIMCHTLSREQVVHGSLTVLDFRTLIPAGIFKSRKLKEIDPVWFHLHYSTMLVCEPLAVSLL